MRDVWGFPGEKGIVAVLKLFLWNVMFRWDITECAQCSRNHQLLKYWFEKGSGQLYHTVKRNTKWIMIQFDFRRLVVVMMYELQCTLLCIKLLSSYQSDLPQLIMVFLTLLFSSINIHMYIYNVHGQCWTEQKGEEEHPRQGQTDGKRANWYIPLHIKTNLHQNFDHHFLH